MTLLTPLALFFLVSVPLVIVLYLLKLRRVDKPISSTLLWRQSLEDLKANTPFQKLRSNLLLFLQLLILILLSLAIARPALRFTGLTERNLIVLLDNSASMGSVDIAPSRLGFAKQHIQNIIDNLSAGDSMMLIAFSKGSDALSPFTKDRRKLSQDLQWVEVTDQPTDMDEAFRIALAAARSQSNPEIFIFSDGAFPELELDREPDAPIRFLQCGARGNNVGIISIGTRRNFESEGQYQITATIQNSSPDDKDLYVEIYAHEENSLNIENPEASMIDAREISIAAGKSKALVLDDPGYYSSILEIRLAVEDDLALDNHAFVALPKKDAVKVLIVTPGNIFLERAFNVDPRTVVSTVASNNYISSKGYDLVAFDNFVPARLDSGRYLFIGCAPPYPECALGEEIERPVVVDWNRLHPLTRYLEMSNLVIRKTRALKLPPWAKTLVDSTQTPLMALLETETASSVIIGFDPYDSDWPLRASFPILFTNLLDWFLSNDPRSMRSFATGDVILAPSMDTETLAIMRSPSGKQTEITLDPDKPVPFGDTGEAGVYKLIPNGGEPLLYVCNLASHEETDNAPKDAFTAGMTDIEAVTEINEQNREIWRPLALFAFFVFVIEWLIYTRRARYGI